MKKPTKMKAIRKPRTAKPTILPTTAPKTEPADKLELALLRELALTVASMLLVLVPVSVAAENVAVSVSVGVDSD